MAEDKSERLADKILEKISKNISNRMSKGSPEKMLEHILRILENISGRI